MAFPRPISTDLVGIAIDRPDIYHVNEDYLVWGATGSRQFSCPAAREAIRHHGESVLWHNAVWFIGYIPRMAFVLLMTYTSKLLTKIRLKAWRCLQEDVCVLCNS